MKNYAECIEELKCCEDKTKIIFGEQEAAYDKFVKLIDKPGETEALNELHDVQKNLTYINNIYCYLLNNAKYVYFHEYMPKIIEIWNGYEGKKLGNRTQEKIEKEVKEKFNCNFTINHNDWSGFFHICDPDFMDMNFNIWFNALSDMVDNENRIVRINMKDLFVHRDAKKYFDNIPATVLDNYALHEEIQEKLNEVIELCKKYNDNIVSGIDKLNTNIKL